MADFTSEFWGYYVAAITIVSVIACAVFLKMNSMRRSSDGKVGTTGHVWDDDLTEWNNPLPRWWAWLFYLTVIFSLVYLALYPGLGAYSGAWGWSSSGQFEAERKEADAKFGPIYAKYLAMDLKQVAADPQAKQMGERLFLNHCAQCHGADAGGSRGFPNLRDNDWLWGGTPEAIRQSVMDGRTGVMPPLGAALGTGEDVKDMAHYVLSLSGRTHDELRAQRAKPKFATVCAACHGAEGKGNPALGAPNLTDKTWLHGGTEAAIVESISRGRNSVMPGHKDIVGEAKAHLIAAYVWSLGGGEGAGK